VYIVKSASPGVDPLYRLYERPGEFFRRHELLKIPVVPAEQRARDEQRAERARRERDPPVRVVAEQRQLQPREPLPKRGKGVDPLDAVGKTVKGGLVLKYSVAKQAYLLRDGDGVEKWVKWS